MYIYIYIYIRNNAKPQEYQEYKTSLKFPLREQNIITIWSYLLRDPAADLFLISFIYIYCRKHSIRIR